MKINPDGAGLDERRLERITDHLQKQYIDAGRIAGAQVVVARHGQVGYFRSFGARDLERSKPIEDDTIFRIFSMTKPITGVALLSLYERGLFQLDDRVSRFIPEWKGLKVKETGPDGSERLVEPKRDMTVRHLLTHTSGLGMPGGRSLQQALSVEDHKPGEAFSPSFRGGGDLATFVSRLAEQPLEFHPGDHWLYTISTDICGRLVEILSGQRFDEYLRTTIFEPLGMSDTGFYVGDDKIDRLAASYRRDRNKKLTLLEDPQNSRYRKEPTFFSGGGGLLSTTADYLRFCQMLLGGGEIDGVRILSRKTVELMASNHLPGGGDMRQFAMPGSYGEVEFAGMGFGLTVSVAQGPAQTGVVGSAGEYMWGGAASTIFWIDPTEDLTVVFMTQFMPSGTFNFRGQLKSIVYGAIAD
ncbi:MAG TPA: serine hydrolase domain-containing protein [Mycobacteriales bacterium]|nr:serine hydrolase domain-containing protein [Mycobacteriales bacterium]